MKSPTKSLMIQSRSSSSIRKSIWIISISTNCAAKTDASNCIQCARCTAYEQPMLEIEIAPIELASTQSSYAVNRNVTWKAPKTNGKIRFLSRKRSTLIQSFLLPFWFSNHKWPFYCVSTVSIMALCLPSHQCGDRRRNSTTRRCAWKLAFKENAHSIEQRSHSGDTSECYRLASFESSIEWYRILSNAIQQYGPVRNGHCSANCY